jgi:tetratricopeptide (TPR) repeat protein
VSAPAAPRARSRAAARALAVGALIWLAALAAYLPVGRNGFTSFDDDGYVTDNPAVRAGLTGEGVRYAFASTEMGNWHPLTWLSHMLDVQLFGLAAGRHHQVSALLHACTALALFLFLRGATGALWRSALAAALFALHPLQVESVAWVAERKEVLAGLLWMLALLAYLRHARAPRPATMAAVALLLGLGLLAKPTLVTFPLVLLLLDAWPLRRPGALGWRRLLAEKLPLFALAAAGAVVTLHVQAAEGYVRDFTRYSPAIRLGNAAVAYAAYLGKALWPARLAVFYPHPGPGLSPALALSCAALFAALCAAALHLARRQPAVAAGWAWFAGVLLPVIGLVQTGDQAYADRYVHLPLAGLCIAAAWGSERLVAPLRPRAVALCAAGAVALLAALGVLTARQAALWRDDETLFRHALQVTEGNWIAHDVLGMALARAGRTREAEAELEACLRANPAYGEAYNNLGYLAFERGDFAAAGRRFGEAARLRPRSAVPLVNLGLVAERLGRADEAERRFSEALQLSPGLALARRHLEALRARTGAASRGGP